MMERRQDIAVKVIGEGSLLRVIAAFERGDLTLNSDLAREGDSPLYLACHKEAHLIVKYLVSLGANVNSVGKYDQIPLHAAIAAGDLQLVKYLWKKGTDIHYIDDSKQTGLHLAAWNYQDIYDFLLSKGARDNQDWSGHTAQHILEEGKKFRAEEQAQLSVDEKQKILFFQAIELGKLSEIERLIHEGANIHGYNERGQFPLYIACKLQSHALEIVPYLLSRGAYINARDGAYKNTPLHAASYYGNLEFVKYLVDQGATLDYINLYGETVLHQAANAGK